MRQRTRRGLVGDCLPGPLVVALLIVVVVVAPSCATVTSDPQVDRVEAAPADAEAERLRVEVERLRAEFDQQLAAGDAASALTTLLQADPRWVRPDSALTAHVRRAADQLTRDQLRDLLAGIPLGQPAIAPVQVAYARRLRLANQEAEARRFAEAALAAGATGSDAEDARALLDGRPLGVDGQLEIAALLPLSGSPALQRFAAELQEGFEAAVAASSLNGDAVSLRIFDDGGDPELAGSLVRSLADGEAVAVIGPLDEPSLRAAVQSRRGTLPLVSPTAWALPAGAEAVYSLSADERQGPESLAAWAITADLLQVVVMHPSVGPGSLEADFFSEAFRASGGSVLRRFTYEPGDAFFREQMEAIRGLRPQALVFTTPPEDVQALATQAAFFALDTLGIQLLGTAGWTDPGVLAEVGSRYTDGVVVAAPVLRSNEREGFERFVAAYESHFQRTLTQPDVAALGYDAASLVLRVLESGARTPAEVARALDDVQDLAGATGVYSVRDGRVARSHEIVCLAEGRREVLGAAERPVPVYRPFEADPETGIVPEGPGHLTGFVCPSRAPSDVPPDTTLYSFR